MGNGKSTRRRVHRPVSYVGGRSTGVYGGGSFESEDLTESANLPKNDPAPNYDSTHPRVLRFFRRHPDYKPSSTLEGKF